VPLATGCLLALLLDDERIRTWASGLAGHAGTWLGIGLLAAVQFWIDDDWTQHAWSFGVVLPVTGLISALLIGGLVSVRSPLSAVLAWTPVSWFGRRVSYSAYLWHPVVIALLGTFAIGAWGKAWLVAVALLVAVGAAYAVEVPVERLRKRVRDARRLVAADRSARETADATA
jgi:peptidoglycan/LPS O-acetylase OafA/YrhL